MNLRENGTWRDECLHPPHTSLSLPLWILQLVTHVLLCFTSKNWAPGLLGGVRKACSSHSRKGLVGDV